MNIIAEQIKNNLWFHAEKCGQRFANIAVIYDWKTSPNPLIMIPRPLGLNATKLIIEEYERLKG